MKHRVLAVALWMTFAFVTWNVVFGRGVTLGAIRFTREQIVRYDQRTAVAPVDSGFRPYVRQAALEASAYAGAVLLCGGLVMFVGRQRDRGTSGTTVPSDDKR